MPPKEPVTTTAADGAREALIRDVIEGYEALMARLAHSHAPEFVEIGITMPQAKVLYLLTAGELHMSALVGRLGVSLSTVSGLVDRLVDHGFVARREDPADRRHVFVSLTTAGTEFIDRFRELNAREMRRLLVVLADDELSSVSHAVEALARATDRLETDRPTAGKEPA